jgi:hypothetical protein
LHFAISCIKKPPNGGFFVPYAVTMHGAVTAIHSRKTNRWRFIMRRFTFALILAVSTTLSGCTNQPNAPQIVGEPRAAINKQEVRIYNKSPTGSAAIAHLSTTYALATRTTDEQKLAYAIGRLQAQAARLGANVIVITDVERESSSAGTIVRGITSDASAEVIAANPYIKVTATAYYNSSIGAGRAK